MNPFQFGRPTYKQEFIGRKEILRDLSNAMLNLQNVSLHSERRTGKTSLLLYIAHSDSASFIGLPENHIPIYFDFQQLAKDSSLPHIWGAITDAIAEHIEQRLPVGESNKFLETIKEVPIELFVTGFGRAFSKLKSDGYKFHLLFDEFETTSQNSNLGDSFYNTLRSLPARTKNLSYIIATRTGLSDLQQTKNRYDSPFFNIFTTKTLGPFQDGEVRELIYKYFERDKIDKELAKKLCKELPFLYRVSGYHPFFLQMICSHLCSNIKKTEWLNEESQKSALQSFEKDSEDYLEWYWNISSIEQKEIIQKIAAGKTIDWDNKLVKKLKDRCIVVEDKDNGGAAQVVMNCIHKLYEYSLPSDFFVAPNKKLWYAVRKLFRKEMNHDLSGLQIRQHCQKRQHSQRKTEIHVQRMQKTVCRKAL